MKKFLNFHKLQQVLLAWIDANKFRLFLLVLIFFFLRILGSLPYVNLILDDYLVFALTIFFATFILSIRPLIFVIFSLVVFFPILAFWLLGRFEEAEGLTNYIYVILLSGVVKGIADLNQPSSLKTKNRDSKLR